MCNSEQHKKISPRTVRCGWKCKRKSSRGYLCSPKVALWQYQFSAHESPSVLSEVTSLCTFYCSVVNIDLNYIPHGCQQLWSGYEEGIYQGSPTVNVEVALWKRWFFTGCGWQRDHRRVDAFLNPWVESWRSPLWNPQLAFRTIISPPSYSSNPDSLWLRRFTISSWCMRTFNWF